MSISKPDIRSGFQLVAKVLLKGVWGDSPSGANGAKPHLPSLQPSLSVRMYRPDEAKSALF